MEQIKAYQTPHKTLRNRPVTRLAVLPPPRPDAGPVQYLFANKTQTEAEGIICRVLEDIAKRIATLKEATAKLDSATIVQEARRIVQVADQLGLSEVATVARHLTQQARHWDGVVMAALLARCERAFDAAIAQVWQYDET